MSNVVRWTPEQLAEHKGKRKPTTVERTQALGRLPVGAMNKTEAAYAAHLECEKQAGRVLWYKFEGMKFRLADSTFYTPDFAVMVSDGNLEAHEVKGHWQDDARVKIKVAAGMYPVKFIAVIKNGAGWKRECF
jgi:hypothetical protein